MGKERKQQTQKVPGKKEKAGAGLDMEMKEKTEHQLMPKIQIAQLASDE